MSSECLLVFCFVFVYFFKSTLVTLRCFSVESTSTIFILGFLFLIKVYIIVYTNKDDDYAQGPVCAAAKDPGRTCATRSQWHSLPVRNFFSYLIFQNRNVLAFFFWIPKALRMTWLNFLSPVISLYANETEKIII